MGGASWRSTPASVCPSSALSATVVCSWVPLTPSQVSIPTRPTKVSLVLPPHSEHLYKGTGDCFKKIAAEEGMAAGLYKGFMANVLRSVGGALVLVFYDRAKVYLEL